MMQFASGDSISIEPTRARSIVIALGKPELGATGTLLTTEEARTLATALLAAVAEAESSTSPREGAMSAPETD